MELTEKVKQVEKDYISSLNIIPRNSKKPLVVAMVGLVGAGKSSVARELAKFINATVLEGDHVRVLLRKANEPYIKNVAEITLNAAKHIFKNGGNIIIDADHTSDGEKLKRLKDETQKINIEPILIRAVCNVDVMIGRIIDRGIENKLGDFFEGAKSGLDSSLSKYHSSVVKIREMWRRTPHHYEWLSEGGGQWKLKELPIDIFATIDTSSAEWKSEVKSLAEKIMS